MEGQIVLAHMVNHFDLTPLFAGAPEPEPLVTLRPKGRLMMRAGRRSSVAASAA
jgi:hypothetical protein